MAAPNSANEVPFSIAVANAASDEAQIDRMAHEAIRTGIDHIVTGFLHHPVRPKPAQVNARPPGEQKSGGRQRDQYPVQRIAKVPKLYLRVVVEARRKRKQQDRRRRKRERGKKARPLWRPSFRCGWTKALRRSTTPPTRTRARKSYFPASSKFLLRPLLMKLGYVRNDPRSAEATH